LTGNEKRPWTAAFCTAFLVGFTSGPSSTVRNQTIGKLHRFRRLWLMEQAVDEE
jgi:hypothetical protein